MNEGDDCQEISRSCNPIAKKKSTKDTTTFYCKYYREIYSFSILINFHQFMYFLISSEELPEILIKQFSFIEL